MTNTTNEERETAITQDMAHKGTWLVTTEDPAIVRKMERIGATFVRELFGGAREYTIRANQLSLRTGAIRERSEAQKALDTINAQRLRDSRATARAKGQKLPLYDNEVADE